MQIQGRREGNVSIYRITKGMVEHPSERMDAIDIVLSAYKSMRSTTAYLSMPITSGKRFYEVLGKYGAKTLEELLKIDTSLLREEIILPNIDEGTILADELSKRIKRPIIAPAIFEAKKQRWNQVEYMFLWNSVLYESVVELYMMDGWEYSNGGSLEFLRGLELQFGYGLRPLQICPEGIPMFAAHVFHEVKAVNDRNFFIPLVARTEKDPMVIFGQSGNVLRIEDGARLICRAIKDLEARDFETHSLKEVLLLVAGIAKCFKGYRYCYETTGVEIPYEIDVKEVLKQIKKAGINRDWWRENTCF